MICYVLMMLDGGRSMAHWATVCSSWVYSSRGSCGRSRLITLGDGRVEAVKAGNLQVARMAMVMQLLWSAGIPWLLEQPASSVMSVHPKMRILYDSMGWFTCRTWMGLFGAPTPKPTVLKSSHQFVFKLVRKMTKEHRERFAQLKAEAEAAGEGMVRELEPDVDGKRRFCGTANLKKSQEYPVGYAEAVFEAFQEWREKSREAERLSDSDSDYGSVVGNDDWADCAPEDLHKSMQMDPEFRPPGL